MGLRPPHKDPNPSAQNILSERLPGKEGKLWSAETCEGSGSWGFKKAKVPIGNHCFRAQNHAFR